MTDSHVSRFLHRKVIGTKRLKRMLGTRFGRDVFRVTRFGKQRFRCPICEYAGPFVDFFPDKGARKHAQCPSCWARERQRLQYLCFLELRQQHDFSAMSLLHVAPDPMFKPVFEKWFKLQHTGDLNMKDVDFKIDLTKLPFEDGSYDVVYASHVLEHIQDDRQALREVRRVLRPGGLAILPVPLVSPETVEYPEPNPVDDYHWRAPGPDYFDRYLEFFDGIRTFASSDFADEFQLYLYEDRTQFPTEQLPLRRPMDGERHVDIVPVCHVAPLSDHG